MANRKLTSPGQLLSPKLNKPKTRKHKLIFLVGFQNTGKDTVADMLVKMSYGKMQCVSFAEALKVECYPLMEVDPKEYSRETDDREWKDAHRAEIIRYGEGQKQKHGMYYWIERALDQYLIPEEGAEDHQYQDLVVTDCRRTEEMMWFKKFKLNKMPKYQHLWELYEPIMLAVHREGAEKDKDYLTHVALEYAAETRTFDRMIKNYGSLEDLERIMKDVYAVRIR
jgi:hypothetical protein